MAHTDKTKPLRVRLWHGALVRIEEHDHRTGVCDLPATLGELLAQPADTRTSCTWEVLLTGVGCLPVWILHRCALAPRGQPAGTAAHEGVVAQSDQGVERDGGDR